MWFIARHGTRGPHKNVTRDLNATLPGIKKAIVHAFADGRSKLCQEDVINLIKWRFIWTPEEDAFLGEAGRKEHFELGQRMGKRFAELLKDSNKTVRKTSPEQRTTDSMEEFLKGMFGHPVDFEVSTELKMNFTEECPAYTNGVYKNNKTELEMNKLKQSQEYKNMVEEISNRIGVQLNMTQVHTARDACM